MIVQTGDVHRRFGCDRPCRRPRKAFGGEYFLGIGQNVIRRHRIARVRQRHVDQLGAQLPQGLGTSTYGLLDLRIHPGHKILTRDAKLQPAYAARQGLPIVRHRHCRRGRVIHVMPGNNLQEKCGILHVFRQWPDLIQGRGKRH